jgi:hypothetical protein
MSCTPCSLGGAVMNLLVVIRPLHALSRKADFECNGDFAPVVGLQLTRTCEDSRIGGSRYHPLLVLLAEARR